MTEDFVAVLLKYDEEYNCSCSYLCFETITNFYMYGRFGYMVSKHMISLLLFGCAFGDLGISLEYYAWYLTFVEASLT